jgi:hypothetical protein
MSDAPPKKSYYRNPQVSITLPPDLHDELLAACKRDDLPIVFWVRDAIRRKLAP